MPARFDRYVPLEVVHRDWLGIAYRAHDAEMRRSVTLRLLHRPVGDARDGGLFLESLRNSLRPSTERLHANVAAVYSVEEAVFAGSGAPVAPGAPTSTVYVTGEWAEGERLSALLETGATLEQARIHVWMSQILRGLTALHGRGSVHGDLNPANILLLADNEILLLDAGLYTRESFPGTDASGSAGWPVYLAPEQHLGQAPDARSDLRAAGVLLYRLLAGRLPFEGAPAAMMHRVLTDDVPDLPPSPCSRRFDEVIACATARAAEARFASAEEFLQALHRVEFEAPRPAPPPDMAWKAAAQQALTAALADAVGPMARVLVDAAVRQAATLAQCHEILAARLSGVVGVDDSALRVLLPFARPPAGPTDRGAWPLCAAEAARVKASLSERIGPMATLLVDRALVQSRSREEFSALLTSMLPPDTRV